MKGIELTNVLIYQLVRVGEEEVQDLVGVVSDEGSMVLNRITGQYCDMEPAAWFTEELLFESKGRLESIIGIDGTNLVPGVTTIKVDDKVFRILFALEKVCVGAITVLR